MLTTLCYKIKASSLLARRLGRRAKGLAQVVDAVKADGYVVGLVIGPHTIEQTRGVMKCVLEKLQAADLPQSTYTLYLGKSISGRRLRGLVVDDVQASKGFVAIKIQGEGTQRYEAKLSVSEGSEAEFARRLQAVDDRRIKSPGKAIIATAKDTEVQSLADQYAEDPEAVGMILMAIAEKGMGFAVMQRECFEILSDLGIKGPGEELRVLLLRLCDLGYLIEDDSDQKTPLFAFDEKGSQILADCGIQTNYAAHRRIQRINAMQEQVAQHEKDRDRLPVLGQEIAETRERLTALIKEESVISSRFDARAYEVNKGKLAQIDSILTE